MAPDFEHLRSMLKAFPDPTQVAVEFRLDRWDCEEIWALLQEVGAAYVCTNSPKSRLQEKLTGKRAYIRLLGRRHWYEDNYSDAELREIAQLARRLETQGASEVYIFFKNYRGGYAFRNALTLREIMGE